MWDNTLTNLRIHTTPKIPQVVTLLSVERDTKYYSVALKAHGFLKKWTDYGKSIVINQKLNIQRSQLEHIKDK